MKLLLTSSGIKNKSIREALVGMLGKPISESSALFVPTGIYPFPGGGNMAYDAICGSHSSSLAQLGWKSLGLLELTALTSIDKKAWVPAVEKTDVLLVWGGDPLYLSSWMFHSGLAGLMHSFRREMVYVGVSAGSMAVSSLFGETYTEPPNGNVNALSSEEILFDTSKGEIRRTFVTARGVGLIDFAIIPHFEHKDHPDASLANAEKWAAKLPVPVYAIDDESAIKVVDGNVEVVSEGRWKKFK